MLSLTMYFIIGCIIFNNVLYNTGCPNKHGNSVTNLISSLLWISIAIPDFKSHNIIMSARVYFMKTVNGCKNVSLMSPQDEQWRRTSLLCLYTVIFLFYFDIETVIQFPCLLEHPVSINCCKLLNFLVSLSRFIIWYSHILNQL